MEIRREGDTCTRAKKIYYPSSESGIVHHSDAIMTLSVIPCASRVHEDDRSLCAAAAADVPKEGREWWRRSSEAYRDGSAERPTCTSTRVVQPPRTSGTKSDDQFIGVLHDRHRYIIASASSKVELVMGLRLTIE